MTPIELAGYVGGHLKKRGISVVLSGGACVAYYSEGKHVSRDLDFVNAASASRDRIRAAMTELGFEEENRYFRHADTEYFIEFPPGPLSIGDEPVHGISEVITSTGSFRILSPTDCVKDRLAGYYHWNDMPSLEQAVLVASQNPVDLDEIKRWSMREGESARLLGFLERLESGT
jgi:hypothetical protein